MGTLGNVLVRGFLFFSSTYQNVCYRRCSTKKIFLMEESFSIWEPSPCHPWSTTQIPNRWWSCLSLSSFSRCIWWKRPARINFDWLINILIGLDLATTTGSMVSLQLGLRREKQHTPCRNCTAEIAAPWPCDPRVSTAGEANLAHYIFHWLWFRITCEASLSVHFLPK